MNFEIDITYRWTMLHIALVYTAKLKTETNKELITDYKMYIRVARQNYQSELNKFGFEVTPIKFQK